MSRQIAGLEAELGVNLLARSTRRMAVTAPGRAYYERWLRVLREVEEAPSVGRRGAIDGPLQLSAPVTFGLACVLPHLRALKDRHPGLRLDLRLEDRRVDLVAEGVDVAIRVGSAALVSHEIVAHTLTAFRRVAVASPPYLERRGEPEEPEALVKHDAITHAMSAGGEVWSLSSDERETRVRVNVLFRTNAVHAIG